MQKRTATNLGAIILYGKYFKQNSKELLIDNIYYRYIYDEKAYMLELLIIAPNFIKEDKIINVMPNKNNNSTILSYHKLKIIA